MLFSLAGASVMAAMPVTIIAKCAVAIVASFGSGDASSSECKYDEKRVPASAECKRNGYCGGTECCFTEVLIPSHEELVPGDKRIDQVVMVTGLVVFRQCDPPFVFLGLTFGWWKCTIETRSSFGEYPLYTLSTCDEVKEPPKSGGGIGM